MLGDQETLGKVSAIRDHLAGPKIGRWGQLQEWMEDRDDPADQHRHVSHLFAVYPGRQISPVATPALAAPFVHKREIMQRILIALLMLISLPAFAQQEIAFDGVNPLQLPKNL